MLSGARNRCGPQGTYRGRKRSEGGLATVSEANEAAAREGRGVIVKAPERP